MSTKERMEKAGWNSDKFISFAHDSGKLSLTCLALGIGFTLLAFIL